MIQAPKSKKPTIDNSRDKKLNLEENLNKTVVVSNLNAVGYSCEACDRVFKDSVSWLDHINSKQHLDNIGVAFGVVRSTLEQVKARHEYFKRKLEQGPEKEYDLQERVDALKAEKDAIKKLKKEKRKEKKRLEKLEQEQHVDPDVSSMMGFTGFGSTKH